MSQYWDRVARRECGRCGNPNPRWEWINWCASCSDEQFKRDIESTRLWLQWLIFVIPALAVVVILGMTGVLR